MRVWILAFGLGVALCGYIPQLPARHWTLLFGLGGLGLQFCVRGRNAGAFLLGLCCFLNWAQTTLDRLWPAVERPQQVLALGTVWSLPRQTAFGWRFEFRLDGLCRTEPAADCRRFSPDRRLVLLNLYGRSPPAPGERWRYLLRLRPPHGLANPGGFDYEAWLLQRDISATGYIRDSELNRRQPEQGLRPLFQRLRHLLEQRLLNAPGAWRHPELLLALGIGERGGLTQRQWELFSALGLNHLMVISGLHIGLVAAVLYRLGLGLARGASLPLPRLLLVLSAPRLAALLSLVGAWCYAGMAGFTLPALRALVMVAVCLGGTLLQRQNSASHALCLALLAVLLLDPLAPQGAGFWLSFVAVAILLRQAGGQKSSQERGRQSGGATFRLLKLQVLLWLGMLPLMLLFFQQSSLAAPLVNLGAIPLVGLLLVPLILLGFCLLGFWPALALPLLRACDLLLYYLMQALTILDEHLSGALLILPQPPWPAFLLYLLLTLCVLCFRRTLPRLVALALLPPLLFWPRPPLPAGALELTVVDVGQGLAVLLRSRNLTLLYDTGPAYGEGADAGGILVPLLRRRGVQALDILVLSHGDSDHAGGLAGLRQRYPARLNFSSEPELFDGDAGAQRCYGQQWQSDGIRFRFLNAPSGSGRRNDDSCVLLVDTGRLRILLPGDIERGAELALLEREPGLRADILLAPHHGSTTSSSYPFLKRLRPRFAVFSAGYLNRFGHPAPEIVRRYRLLGIRTFNTASSGALRFRIDRRGRLGVEEYRVRRPRFWYR